MERLIVGQMATNCYVVDDMIIDPGDDAEYIMAHVKTKPKMIVATHGHFDHIMAAYALQLAYNIPFYIHDDDVFLLSRMESSAKHFLGLQHVDPPPKPSKLTTISYVHTPGHTPGSICLPFGDDLFVGDTIFAAGAVGRTDFSYSSEMDLKTSLKKILTLPSDTLLFPGHGATTSVGKEKLFHRV